MQHAAQGGRFHTRVRRSRTRVRRGRIDEPPRILVRFTVVQDDRQVQFAGESKLAGENSALHLARREIVVIVQTDLPYGDHLRLCGQLGQVHEDGFIDLPDLFSSGFVMVRRFRTRVRRWLHYCSDGGLMAMNAHRSIESWSALGQSDPLLAGGQIGAARDHAHHARAACAGDHIGTIRLESRGFEVSV